MKAKSMTKCLCQYTLLIFITTFLPFFCTSLSAFERHHGTLFPPDKIFLLEEPTIIDWDPVKESPFGPPIDMRVSKSTVIKDVERIGFELIEKHRFMPYHYFLVFRKKP